MLLISMSAENRKTGILASHDRKSAGVTIQVNYGFMVKKTKKQKKTIDPATLILT